jgi:hypothetical protein
MKHADGTIVQGIGVPGDIAEAIVVVANVFKDVVVSRKHCPGDWRHQGWAGNFGHFSEHVASFVKNGEFITNDDHEDHLANACCRLLLLLQMREEALAARKD